MWEIRVLQKLRPHPGILELKDVVHTSSHLLLVTERGGVDLFEFLGRFIEKKHKKENTLVGFGNGEGGGGPGVEGAHGESSGGKSNSKGLSYELCITIMEGISSAIAHCHANNVCHRDLKPENILLTPGTNADG